MTVKPILTRVVQAGSSVREYVAAVLGERDYDRYVAHMRREHPDADVPTRGQYWRDRYAEQDRMPQSRCC